MYVDCARRELKEEKKKGEEPTGSKSTGDEKKK